MGNLVGRSLAHFHIEAQLGEGGMGVVYRATDEKLRRQVALKVLPESFAKDGDRRRRFLREARSAAAITHANIATVYEVGESNGLIFIAMELVEGKTLRARLDDGISVPEGVRIAKEIARGLGRAHEKGIVHRDLKPENVMVSGHDEVKILDFGLAKLREPAEEQSASAVGHAETASNLTGPGRLLGTPAYMSPEQARGIEVDARTDVFSFGVVLYEMVAGGRPFVGQTTQDVITSVLRDTPARPSVTNPLVPQDIERVIERCLEKERDARYADGREILNALSSDESKPYPSDPSPVRKVPSTPTVSLVTPGPSTLGMKSKPRWPLGLGVVGALGAAGLGWGYLMRTTNPAQVIDSDISASSITSTTAPVAIATTAAPPESAPLPVPIPAPVPDAGSSAAPSAAVTSKSPPKDPPRIATSASAAPSTTHTPKPPKALDQLFDTQK